MQTSWAREDRLRAFIKVPTRWPVSTASTSCSPRPTARVSSWWRRTVRNPLRGLPLSPAAGPFYQAFQTRRPVAVLQDEDLQQILPLDPIYRDHPFFRSQQFVIAPLVVGDRAVGAVCVDNKTSRRRSVLQASSPLPCSVSSSPALEEARLYAETHAPGARGHPSSTSHRTAGVQPGHGPGPGSHYHEGGRAAGL